MRITGRSAKLVCAGALLALTRLAYPGEATAEGLTGNAKNGAHLYRRYCVSCHGDHGNGEGESARYLDPRPRDFTAAVFKCRSTPTGSLPLDSDLYRTIGRGVHASAMPSWGPLMRQERADLVAFIKTFSPRFAEEKPQAALQIPAEPASTEESVNRGKELYKKMECGKCHGAEGRGNGPAVGTLTDSKNHPIVPYDFTSGERFKCGDTNEDLYRIFMTGLDGTPMPSFLEDLKPEEAWDLVHYLRTMQSGTESKSLLTRAKSRAGGSKRTNESAAVKDTHVHQ